MPLNPVPLWCNVTLLIHFTVSWISLFLLNSANSKIISWLEGPSGVDRNVSGQMRRPEYICNGLQEQGRRVLNRALAWSRPTATCCNERLPKLRVLQLARVPDHGRNTWIQASLLGDGSSGPIESCSFKNVNWRNVTAGSPADWNTRCKVNYHRSKYCTWQLKQQIKMTDDFNNLFSEWIQTEPPDF
jgi:hypothetical protein